MSRGIGKSVGIYPTPEGTRCFFVDPNLPDEERLEILKIAAAVMRKQPQ